MEEFRIYHNKSTLYHLQANGIVDEYNNILKTALTKVCNVQHDNWDQIILVVLWVYRATQKRSMGHTPFKLVYRKEAIIPMEFIASYGKDYMEFPWKRLQCGDRSTILI